MASEAQILAKLDRPPAAHNWARSNFQEQSQTTRALVNLAFGFPQVSYQWAIRIIQIVLADARTDQEAEALLRRCCPAVQLERNADLLQAFLAYRAVRQFDGLPVYPEFYGCFMAGADVSVPVRPTAIIRENGVLKPIFVIPWAHNGLKYFQRRLLSTLYEDAIYSLTDFRKSQGEVLIFPEDAYGNRCVDRWIRGSYDLLSRQELVAQVERFVTARQEARLEIPVRLKAQEAKRSAASDARRRPDSSDPSNPIT